MKRLAALVVLALVFVPVHAAEDFTGKWSGTFAPIRPDGSTGNDSILMDLKQKGTELTGTAGPSDQEQWPLKGTVDGNKVTFQVERDGRVIKFTLTFADGHLKGDAVAEFEGQKMTAKIDTERKK